MLASGRNPCEVLWKSSLKIFLRQTFGLSASGLPLENLLGAFSQSFLTWIPAWACVLLHLPSSCITVYTRVVCLILNITWVQIGPLISFLYDTLRKGSQKQARGAVFDHTPSIPPPQNTKEFLHWGSKIWFPGVWCFWFKSIMSLFLEKPNKWNISTVCVLTGC